MMKYFRTPADPVLPGSVFSEARFPGMHTGNHTAVILTGPEEIFSGFNLGNISSSRIQFVATEYQPGAVTHRHSHPEKQIYFIIAGQAAITVNGQESMLAAGGVVFIPGGVPHGFVNVGQTPLQLLDIHSYEFDGVANQLGIAAVTYGAGGRTKLHSHDDREEIYYVVSGQASVTVGDEQAILGPRGLAFIPKGTAHGYHNTGSEPVHVLVVSSYDL